MAASAGHGLVKVTSSSKRSRHDPQQGLNHPELGKELRCPPSHDPASQAELTEDENHSHTSSGSTRTALLLTSQSLVTPDMADAIRRQQKGEGIIRYWKAKQAKSLLPNHKLQPAALPVLQHTAGKGRHVGTRLMVNGVCSLSANRNRGRVKALMVRQTNKDYGLASCGRSSNTSLHSHYPNYAQYTMAHYHGQPAALPVYRRSFSTLETRLSHPPLTQQREFTSQSLNTISPQKPDGTLNHKITSTGQGVLPQCGVAPANNSDGNAAQPEDLLDLDDKEPDRRTSVNELTCLQLADTILSTKVTDWSRLYKICQTKIRYVDLLENPTFMSKALSPRNSLVSVRNHSKQPNKSLLSSIPDGVTSQTKPSIHAVCPGNKISRQTGNSSVEKEYEGNIQREGTRSEITVTFPSLDKSETSDVITPCNSRTFIDCSSDGAPRIALPEALTALSLSEKPTTGLFGEHEDTSGQHSLQSLLPGTSAYYSQLNAGITRPTALPSGETRMSRSQEEMKKRAVRFSIPDQVHEFTPTEPVSH